MNTALSGWAAIGAYLGITWGTLQSWRDRYARTDPMPIVQPGGRKGRVYAYPDQLDDWMRRRAAEPDDTRPARDRVVVFSR